MASNVAGRIVPGPIATPRAPAEPDDRANQGSPQLGRIIQALLVISVFLSSWAVLRVGSINLTFSDVAFLLALTIMAGQRRLGMTPFQGLTPFWLAGLLMMLGGLFVSSLLNGDPVRWLNIAAQYTVSLLFIPIVLLRQPRSATAVLPLAFVLGTSLSELIGIAATFAFNFHQTVSYLGDGFITGNGRLGAMAGQPNPNGAMVAFSLPMLLYSLRTGVLPRWLAMICGPVLIWGLMLSASFTGFFAAVCAIGCSLLLLGVRHVVRLGLVGLVAGALFVASGAPLPKAFQQRVGSAVENGDIDEAGTFINRAQLIDEAWHLAEGNTVIGMGVDRYRELSQYDNPVHDLYLLIWNEGGVVAFVGLMTMLVLIVIMALAGLRERREESAMACAVGFVFLVYTVSYPHMYSRMWIMPVMVALATIYADRREILNARNPAATSASAPADKAQPDRVASKLSAASAVRFVTFSF